MRVFEVPLKQESKDKKGSPGPIHLGIEAEICVKIQQAWDYPDWL